MFIKQISVEIMVHSALLMVILLSQTLFVAEGTDIDRSVYLTDVYRTDASAAAARGRKGNKKGKSDDTTCANDFNTVYLEDESQICGANLSDGTKKYVIDVKGKVDCGVMNGPTISNGAILDCDGTEIVGAIGNSGDGITVDGPGIVENCKTSLFTNGVVLISNTDSGEQIVYNTESEENSETGFLVMNTNAQLLSIEASENGVAGVSVVDSVAIVRDAELNDNEAGLLVDNTNSGSVELYNIEAKDNVSFGISITASPFKIDGVEIEATKKGVRTEKGIEITGGEGEIYNVVVKDTTGEGIQLVDGTGPINMRNIIIEDNIGLPLVVGNSNVNTSPVIVKCSNIVDNEGPVTVTLASLTMSDSNVSGNGPNPNFSVALGRIFLTRVRTCDVPGDEITLNTATGTSFSSLTCDFYEACDYSCEECGVEIPEWCDL